MALQLRPARITDLPAIYRGEESYIRCWEPEHEALWRIQLERHLTRWVENFDRLTIALVGHHSAGYSLWEPEQDHAQLSTIHVGAEYRRSGVGMALLQAFAVDAARQGFSRLRLSVRPDQRPERRP
jgi:ribosomal protein S18 acetylase RimI-like enzyme